MTAYGVFGIYKSIREFFEFNIENANLLSYEWPDGQGIVKLESNFSIIKPVTFKFLGSPGTTDP